MTEPRFAFTDKARPMVQLGLGDTRVPTGSAVWDTARWEPYAGGTATWGGLEPAWLDVSCYVHEVEMVSGRERFVDRFQPGTSTVTFKNSDGWADLAGTPGQIAALSLRPGRAIRIGVEIDLVGVTWLWRGVVDSCNPDYDPTIHDIVTVNCIDVLADVGSTKLALTFPDGADDTADQRIARILDRCQWPTQKRTLEPSTTKMIPVTMDGQAIDMLGQTADSAGGVVYGDLDGNIVFKDLGWQEFDDGSGPDASIGNLVTGTPAVPGVINPAYVSVKGPPVTDVSTPETGTSMRLPSTGFTIFVDAQQDIGAAQSDRFLVGQTDPGLGEWWVRRDSLHGTWSIGFSTDGTNFPPSPYFTVVGATPITGQRERIALTMVIDDDSGIVLPGLPFLQPTVGTASTPDTADMYTTDTMAVTFCLRKASLNTGAAVYGLASQGASGQVQWNLQFTNGALELRLSSNGTASTVFTVCSFNEVASYLVVNRDQWLGVMWDHDTGSAGVDKIVTRLLTSHDGITWSERFTKTWNIAGSAIVPWNSTGPVRVGQRWDGSPLDGRIYWAEMRKGGALGMDTAVWRFDAAEHTSGTVYTDPRGRTWTLTSGTAIEHTSASFQGIGDTLVKAWRQNTVGRWEPIDAGQRIDRMRKVSRVSPVRVGRWSGATAGTEWNGRVSSVALVGGDDPNLPGAALWKMDVSEHTSGSSWTDPRGRVWTVTGDAANIVDPPDVPPVEGTPGDICPVDWENSFDRSEITTQVLLNRTLPEPIPELVYNLSANTARPAAYEMVAGEMRMAALSNPTDQTTTTELYIHQFTATGLDAVPYIRNIKVGTLLRIQDRTNTTNATRTFRVITADAGSGPAIGGSYWGMYVAWQDGETPVPVGQVSLGVAFPALAPSVVDDQTGQVLYGIEPYELLDLISTDGALFSTLATRIFATRGYTSAPRIEAVTIDASRGDDETMILMATCRPELPSRYRCRLRKDRLIFDKEMFATGVRHFMSQNEWTLRISLDVAAWAGV